MAHKPGFRGVLALSAEGRYELVSRLRSCAFGLTGPTQHRKSHRVATITLPDLFSQAYSFWASSEPHPNHIQLSWNKRQPSPPGPRIRYNGGCNVVFAFCQSECTFGTGPLDPPSLLEATVNTWEDNSTKGRTVWQNVGLDVDLTMVQRNLVCQCVCIDISDKSMAWYNNFMESHMGKPKDGSPLTAPWNWGSLILSFYSQRTVISIIMTG